MIRYVKVTLTCLVLLITAFASAQKPVVYYFSEIGLTLYLPTEFKVLDAARNEAINKKGLKAVQESSHMSVDISKTKTLIAAKKTALDYFNVTISPYDVKNDPSHAEASRAANGIIYKTLQDKIPAAKIDSASTVTKLDGLVFNEFTMNMVLNDKVTMHMIMLSRYYKRYDLGISYVYTDDITKKQLETLLQSCKFARK